MTALPTSFDKAALDGANSSIAAPGMRTGVVLASIVLLHVGLGTYLAGSLNVWLDDAFTLETTDHGVVRAAERAIAFELQPPGYYALLATWRNALRAITGSDAAFAARMFSVLCASSFVLLSWPLAQRYLPGVHPGWLVAFTATNPFVMWAAVEIRCYAFVLLLVALLLLWFHDGWLSPAPRTSARVAFVVTAVVGLYSFYYVGFPLVAGAVVLAVERRWRALRDYLLAMAVVGLLILPLAWIVPGQIGAHRVQEGARSIGAAAAAKFVVWRIEELLFPANRLLGERAAAWFWRMAVVAGGVTFALGVRRLNVSGVRIATGLLAVTALPFVALVAVDPQGTVELRHTAPLLAPAGIAMTAFLAAAVPRAMPWILACVCTANVGVLATDYAPMAKSGDWQRVATWLRPRVEAGEAIVVFTPIQALPLARHHDGPGVIVPIPAAEDFERYDPAEYVLTDGDAIDVAIRRAGCPLDRVILVRAGGRGMFGIDYRTEVLEEWWSTRYEVVDEQRFHGSTVRVLRRR